MFTFGHLKSIAFFTLQILLGPVVQNLTKLNHGLAEMFYTIFLQAQEDFRRILALGFSFIHAFTFCQLLIAWLR